MKRTTPTTLALALLWLLPLPLPAQSTGEADSARVQLHGFADVAYVEDFGHPADGDTFFAGVGTSGKRANAFSLNQARIEVSADPLPVGFRVAVGLGTGLDVVHAGEPAGSLLASGSGRSLLYASATYKAPVGRGLLLEAGVFPCHVGFEGFDTKDNWNYTRSWEGELSPYYVAGLKAGYAFSDRWSAQVHLLNGWQLVADNNHARTIGTQLAYGGGKVSVTLNTMVGPELAGDDHDWRLFGDLVATVRATSSLSLGAGLDLAREARPHGSHAHWNGLAVYARLAPRASRSAVALRLERFDDPDGAISGTLQRLDATTLTIEHRPTPHLILKIEGRYDRSTAAVFAGAGYGSDGAPARRKDQTLLLAGLVAAF